MTDGDDEDVKPQVGGEPLEARAQSAEPDAARAGADDAEEPLRRLVRGAMHRSEPEAPDVLGGVQKKLRARSGGKFYADAWSTGRQPPIAFYLLTSLLMLVIVLVVYLVLSPTAGAPAHVDNTPAPVHILPPPR